MPTIPEPPPPDPALTNPDLSLHYVPMRPAAAADARLTSAIREG